MKDLVRTLLLSATLLTSVSAGPSKPPVPSYFIPPAEIEIDLKDWEWMSMNVTGKFHIDVKYPISNEEEIIAHYQAVKKNDKWYKMLGSYEIEPISKQ